jgi:hypothetical protein
MLRGDDGELREYEIVSSRERESVFQVMRQLLRT